MTVKPLTDRHRVSHEELSYIVDSTGSPVATVLPFNAWPIYVAGLVAGTIPLLPDTQTAVNFFFETIPYNFYGWLAVLGTLLLAIGIMPWVNPSLKRAIHRAEKTGQLDAPKARPIGTLAPSSDADRPWARPGPLEFVLPLLMLLGVAITPAVLALLRGEKPNVPIAEAFALAWLTAFLVSILRGRSLSDVFDASVDGIKSVTLGGIILGLALVLGTNMKELQAADFILATFKDAVPTAVLPVFLFFLCMVVAFGTGTSFGTFAVVFPIALPLAWQMVPDPSYISVSFGAILGGAVFGDQCSPISDTTVLSSLSSGCDLMDHVTTQLPQALLIAAVAGLLTFAATLSIL
jgi:Na+/H+ antiporter NhaC